MKRIFSLKLGFVLYTILFLCLLIFFNFSAHAAAGNVQNKQRVTNLNRPYAYDVLIASHSHSTASVHESTIETDIYTNSFQNGWSGSGEIVPDESTSRLIIQETAVDPTNSDNSAIYIETTSSGSWRLFNLHVPGGAYTIPDGAKLSFRLFAVSGNEPGQPISLTMKTLSTLGIYSPMVSLNLENSGSDTPQGEWSYHEVDLDIGSINIEQIAWQGASSGSKRPTYYLDDIKIIEPDPTVSTPVPTPTSKPVTPVATSVPEDGVEHVYIDTYQNGWSGEGEIVPGESNTRLIIQEAAEDPTDSDNSVIYIESTSSASWRLFNLNVPGGSYTIPDGAKLSFRLFAVSGNEPGEPISLTMKTLSTRNIYSPKVPLNLENSGSDTPLGEWSYHEIDLDMGSIHIEQIAWQGATNDSKRPIYYLDDIKIIGAGPATQTPTPTPSTPIPTSAPSDSDEIVYIDSYQNNWSGDGEIGVVVQEEKADPTNSSNKTIHIETNSLGNWKLFNLNVPGGSYTVPEGAKLSFKLFGVSGNTSEAPLNLQLKTRNHIGGYSPSIVLNAANSGSDIVLGQWTYHEIDLKIGANHEVINQIAWQGASSESKRPIYYLDDIKIIGGKSTNQAPTLTPAPPNGTPTPNDSEYTISVNNGKIFTRRSEVTLHFTAPDSTAYVKVSNDGGFAGSEWQPYSETVLWEIDQFLNFLLPRVVYARFKDANGSVTSVYSDDIILDVLAPWGNGHAIKSNNKYNLKLEADDDVSGIDQFRLSNENTFSTSNWRTFEPGIEINLVDLAEDSIFLQLSDKAGNVSEPIEVEVLTQSIYLPITVR